jgi:hypothetical protein
VYRDQTARRVVRIAGAHNSFTEKKAAKKKTAKKAGKKKAAKK